MENRKGSVTVFGPREVWRPSFAVETPMLSYLRAKLSTGNMAEYQIEVEYTGNQNAAEQEWISFVVAASSMNSDHYSFPSLVEDISRRCSSLNHVNENVMCLRCRYRLRQ